MTQRKQHDQQQRQLLPLTPAQRGMWFADRLSPNYSVNVAQYVDIRHEPGGLDIDLFLDCSYQVGRELETPYIRLTEVDGVPMQYVDVDYDQTIDLLDFRDEADPAAAAADWMLAEYRRPVDLVEDQLIVIAIIRVADDHTIWYQRAHHLIIDGYAGLTNMRRLLDLYNAARRGEDFAGKPAAVLAEIVDYENRYAGSSRWNSDREHWLERVRDLPERVTLARSNAPAPLSFENVVAGQALDADLQERLNLLARELGSSLAVLLTSAFGAFLGRMTATDDIALSLPITGRLNAKIKRSGGMVSNVVPIRLRDVTTQTPRQLIAAALVEMTGALRHQRYRTEDIRRDAGLDGGSIAFGPTINMVIFDEDLILDGAELEYKILASGVLEDLFVNLYQSSPGAPLVVDLHGNPHLYNHAELNGHLERFLSFLEAFADGLDTGIGDLPILLAGEGGALSHWENGPAAEPVEDNLLGGFSSAVASSPSAVAVVDGDRTWTYEEFDNLRRQLASCLAAAGVRSGSRIAVDLPRGIGQLAAIYAIVTCGAAFVPLDPKLPESRRAHILAVADAALVIDAPWLSEAKFNADGAPTDAPALPELPGGDRAAYVIFTSGSTGTPKGVQVSHQAILNRLEWVQRSFPIAADDVWMYKTPATFDPSVVELFWALQRGARLVIAAPDGHGDPGYLRELITDHGITTMHFVPSMLDAFADSVDGARAVFPPSLRRVFTSGEALAPDLADRAISGSETELINVYGPTEAAVDVTMHRVSPGEDPMPIGSVVDGTAGYVLDARLRRVPVGVPGELYLAGVQLAHGYVSAAGLTADRFVASPFGTGERMYRTGDLVRWNGAGELEYLGRTDFQIKIRGQRVELGEIEQVMRGLPGVDAVVAVARQGARGAEIVVYARAAGLGGDETLEAQLLQRARNGLPAYMVPSAVVVLDTFPVTDAGKLDRRALPEPVMEATAEATYRAPESEAESRLAELLGDLLGVEKIGMDHNIFELGADSLTAARLVARARSRAGLDLSVGAVLSGGTIGAFAQSAKELNRDGHLPLVPQPRPATIPVAHPQARLWFINRMDPAAATYNMPGAVRLRGDLQINAMHAAVGDVVGRHESLRTMFPAVEGEPVQSILPEEEAVALIRLAMSETDDEGLFGVLATEAGTGFDLVAEPPVRFGLVAVADADGAVDSHVLMVVLHHIAGDGASLPPLIVDLLTAYTARMAGAAPTWEPLPVQYADFTLWQREVLGQAEDADSRLSHELKFWTANLAGSSEVLALPFDRPRTVAATGAGDYVDAQLSPVAANGLRELARAHGVTTFTVLHAALAALLARVAGTDDVAIGTAIAGRDEPELADLIGMFVNTVVLRTRVRPADTVAGLLDHAHAVRGEAMEHASAPFEAVVDAVAHRRSLTHSPLFQVALTLIADHASAFAGAEVEILSARPPVAKYDLALTATEADDESIALEYSFATDVFDRATIERFASYFTAMISAMVDDPSRSLGSVSLLPAAEIATLTAPVVSASPRTLRKIIIDGEANAQPLEPAVVGGEVISREVFAMRTNQLARELIDRGVGPGSVVAVAMARSELSVLACIAIAKTGAAFVSVDPRHPRERRELMLATSGAAVGLTTVDAELDDDGDTEWIVVNGEAEELHIAGRSGLPVADDELVRPVEFDDAAYLIFTSGSTGVPKATVVSHRGLANLVENQRRWFDLDQRSRVLHVASPSFDASVFELTMALAGGSTLVVADIHTYAGHDLERLIAAQRVTHAVMTPSTLGTLDPRAVPTLRTVMSAGEACPAEVLRRWAEHGRRFFNLYGPTEATIWATVDGPLRASDQITIGQSLNGVGALVLDSSLHPTPVGVSGELYLTGDQLALGYLQRMGQTATAFVADPFRFGQRMYRTGDRVVRRADGKLTYLGRADFQLKVRGMRIEPGEVDAALMAHSSVGNALSIGVEGPAGETVLVSYVSPVDGRSVDPDVVIAHAREVLPPHMVPQTVMVVEEFPTTVVGKIDRAQLPAVDFRATTEFIPPRTPQEAVIAQVYAQVLGVDRVSVQDGFFELGGTSLSAAKLATQLSQVLGRPVSVKAIFEGGSVAGVAAAVAQLTAGPAGPALMARPRAELVPISDVQRGMWLLNQADPDSPAYNIAMALRLEGELDLAALRAAVADLVERQEALRTSYPMVGGRSVQLIEPADKVIAQLDLAPKPVGDDLPAAVAAVTGVGFDVTVAPPLRVAVLELGADDHVVIFVIHHISADGSSMAPLARDFMAAYVARTDGHAPHWLPLRVQYADFAGWQEDRLDAADDADRTERDRQLDYWRDRLAGAPEVIELPTDRPRPASPSFSGSTVDFEIPAELVRTLQALGRQHNATLFMVTHAAMAILLARLGGRGDVVIGTPYAGRNEAVLDDVVGMFVNTLAMRSVVDLGAAFADFLAQVRTDDLADMAHAEVSFDSIASAVGAARTGAFNPVFQTMFTFQNLDFPTVSLDKLTISAVHEELTAAKVDLQLTLFPNDPAVLGDAAADAPMRAQLLYATDLFDEVTVQRYAERYLQVLTSIADDPNVVVGDISIATEAEERAEADAADHRSLGTLVSEAALSSPDAVAISDGGIDVVFSTLSVTATALAAAMPDADAALTTAVMSLAPGVAVAGPDRLGEVLADLRSRALAALAATNTDHQESSVQRP